MPDTQRSEAVVFGDWHRIDVTVPRVVLLCSTWPAPASSGHRLPGVIQSWIAVTTLLRRRRLPAGLGRCTVRGRGHQRRGPPARGVRAAGAGPRVRPHRPRQLRRGFIQATLNPNPLLLQLGRVYRVPPAPPASATPRACTGDSCPFQRRPPRLCRYIIASCRCL